MTLSSLPLSYCTNVHPGKSVTEVLNGLGDFTIPARRRFGHDVAAGLWLAQSVAHEILRDQDGLGRFAKDLRDRGLTCYTLNAFPYGDFHGNRVKEQVYLPDWADPKRQTYTRDCATILASLLPEGVEGSISTVPLGFKGFVHPPEFLEQCCVQLIELSEFLARLEKSKGRCIRLAIEPEPFCVLETIPEAIHFFRLLRRQADAVGARENVDRFIGLCLDVCHQAVEYEDIPDCFKQLQEESIRINKLHITCAIELVDPQGNETGRLALARYAEPRYLHQTIGRCSNGETLRTVDLTSDLALQPPEEYLRAESWRIHFHVPVSADSLGALKTTRPQLCQALLEVPKLEYAPHLEVETYTWEVLPEAAISPNPSERLIEGLAAELAATTELINSARMN